MQGDHAAGHAVGTERSRKDTTERAGTDAGPTDQALPGVGLTLPGHLSPETILALQRTVGNRAVQRLLAQQTSPAASARAASPSADRPVAPSMPPSIALFVQRFTSEPHEQITAAGLRRGRYGDRAMQDIQIGNWLTDWNQMSEAAPYLRDYLGFDFTPEMQFQIVRLMAVSQFGAEATSRVMGNPAAEAQQRLTRQQPQPGDQQQASEARVRFGTYRPAEHFDNPERNRDAAPERAGAAPQIATSIGNIEENLGNAISSGPTSVGRQYYGRALHTLEDYFSHTNFVHIAMRMADPNRSDPRRAQPEPYGGRVESTGESGYQYQLTSGIFPIEDTILSLLHLLLNEIRKPSVPGEITPGERIAQMIVAQVSPMMGRTYQTYLDARSAVGRVVGGVSSSVSGIARRLNPFAFVRDQARELAIRVLETAVNRAMRAAGRQGRDVRIPRSAEEAENVALQGVGRVVTGTGRQPSHTRMNVDDPASDDRLFPVARDLAQFAVTQVDPLMQAAWGAAAGPARVTAQQRLVDEVRRLLVHPEQDLHGWWRPIVDRHLRSQ